MNILALDTALGGCSLACVMARGQAERQVVTARDQAAILVPLINDVLAEAGVSPADLDLIVTTVGPGSFTGLRIGLSTARAYALAIDKPLVGVGTMTAAARQINKPQSCAVILETKRSDFYCQLFDEQSRAISEPEGLSASDVVSRIGECRVILAGDALARFDAEVGSDWQAAHVIESLPFTLLDPIVLAACGQELYALGQGTDTHPLYLRGADVTAPKNPLRVMASS
jgi:tRNA threonylcarbamoyladenosine biosynthesis protein TsaB